MRLSTRHLGFLTFSSGDLSFADILATGTSTSGRGKLVEWKTSGQLAIALSNLRRVVISFPRYDTDD